MSVGSLAQWRAVAFTMVTAIASAAVALVVHSFIVTEKLLMRIVKLDFKPLVALAS